MDDRQLRKISHSAETAKALADDAPFTVISIPHQTVTNGLTVTDNIICTEFLEVLRLLYGITLASEGVRCDGRAQAGAALIQEKDLDI